MFVIKGSLVHQSWVKNEDQQIINVLQFTQNTITYSDRPTDHLIFQCKKLRNQRNENIKQIKNTGGN